MSHGRAFRRTLASPATIRGVTLFTGATTTITLRARAIDAANPTPRIEFRRVDLPGAPPIPALAPFVTPEYRRTVLSSDPKNPKAPSVQTVEHLMSALAGLGISDAIVELDGAELPIGDGSAKLFVDAILAAKTLELEAKHAAAPVVLREPIIIDDPKTGAKIEATPHDKPGLELIYKLEYPPGAAIAPQQAALFLPFNAPVENYETEIAPARTFSLQQEAEMARKMGLFAHLSPKDMLVIGSAGPIDNVYRFENEPARHKLLDLLGDLALCGLFSRGVQARVVAHRSGHFHNHLLAQNLALAADKA